MELEAYYQPNSDYEPVKVIVVGFSASGTFGASAVAIFYRPDKPSGRFETCPVYFLHKLPISKGSKD